MRPIMNFMQDAMTVSPNLVDAELYAIWVKELLNRGELGTDDVVLLRDIQERESQLVVATRAFDDVRKEAEQIIQTASDLTSIAPTTALDMARWCGEEQKRRAGTQNRKASQV